MMKGQMDLYFAIKNNDVTRVEEILKYYDVSENEFCDKVTFVSLAVLNNNCEILNSLINHGADVNRLSYISYQWPKDKPFNSFETPLITATRHNNIDVCELLLKNNAKLNKADSFSMTALHWACSLDLIDIVRLLFRYNVDPNVLDLKNQTPLDKALSNSNSLSNKKIIQLFAQHHPSLQYKYRDYLLTAIKNSNYDIFRILLDQLIGKKVTLDLNSVDESVGSLLHYAVILTNLSSMMSTVSPNSQSSKIRIVQNLIDQGGVEINIANRMGVTPLHMCKNVQVCRMLLDKGAKMDLCEVTGKMPLFTHLISANYDMCIEMLKNGCNLENKDRLGNSLLYALMNSNAPVKLISLLLEAGISLGKEEWLKQRQYPKRLVQKYPKLVHLIEYKLKNPPTLKELARKSLRLHLSQVNRSKSIVNSVSKLEKHLPSTLQDYILLNLNKSLFMK